MENNVINIRDLNKSFNGEEVLSNINLSIKRGTITGFIGKSGAGKTTLLRCMNLLEKPNSGQIEIEGNDIVLSSVDSLKILRQKIGMIFQSFNILTSRTTYDNIAFPLELIKLPKAKIDKKVRDVATLVGLEKHLMNYQSTLSGGQKQRVAIARALISDATILLCDEFTSALDPETTLDILSLLRDINSKLGVTIILISHDISLIREICDYVYVIDRGRIIEDGDIEQIFYNTKHEVTKSLIKAIFVQEVPNALKSRLVSDPNENDEVMLRLIFSNTSTKEPVISKLIMQFNIPVNIISGHYDHFRDSALGNLLITFKYERILYLEMIKFIEQHKVHHEFLGYLRGKA
jgi:D-methionine transport system ATP-binding protein